MKVEELIHINKNNIEDSIKRAIDKTKDELYGLTTQSTCMIYSSYLSRNLYNEHIPNKLETTTKYKYPYHHQFNIVQKNKDEFYLIDLTYTQFQSTKFYELLQKGYILINSEEYLEYLEVVGNVKEEKEKQIILSFYKKIV